MERLADIPAGVTVTSMVVHAGQLFVATSDGLYRLSAEQELVPVRFAPAKRPPLLRLLGFWSRVWDR